MADPREHIVLDHFQRSRETLERAAGQRELLTAILAIIILAILKIFPHRNARGKALHQTIY